ncbi:MAG: hypothetical protein AB7Q00_09775 [Phycisphaerales bacterium]
MTTALPHQLLHFAEEWLSACDSPLMWLIGEPGSGKSTLLRACSIVCPMRRTVELGAIRAATQAFSAKDGGLRRLGRIAELVRNDALALGTPTVVAACSIPPVLAGPRRGETVFVLLPPEDQVLKQRRQRPARTLPSADENEAAYHRMIVAELSAMPHVQKLRPPFLPALLGADAAGETTPTDLPRIPLAGAGD